MEGKLKEIIIKSRKLFTKFGIKSVSMDDIAKGCGMSKKTLYEHVTDKRDLVTKVLEQEFQEESYAPHAVNPHAINIEQLSAIDALFAVYKSAVVFYKDFNISMEYDLIKYYPDLFETVKMKRRKRLYEKFSINMLQGRKEKMFREDFNIDIIAKLHILKIESLLNTDIFEEDDYSVVEIFKELFLYHFSAIATDKGRDALYIKIKEMENV
jgi:AcrR family transcriptional regulator